MKNIFVVLLLLSSFSCAQESAEIIYRHDSSRKTKTSSLKPSYIKGSYVENSDKDLVRDLRKDYSRETKIANNSKICDKFAVVNEGDSLLKIARKCNCSLSDIANINDIKPPYNVYVGQKIKTNCNGKAKSPDTNKTEITYKTVIVKKGSSLTRIAINNNSTVRELATINSIEPPYNVYVGQKIKIPVKNSDSNSSNIVKDNNSSVIKDKNVLKNNSNNFSNTYVVEKGDNIYSIARKTNSNFSELIAINNLKKPYKIYVGQKLKVATGTTQDKNEVESGGLVRVEDNTELTVTSKQESVSGSESIFIWPIKGEVIKKFGKQDDGSFNDAINIKSTKGIKVQAADDGEVAYAGNELKGFGNIVIIKHKNGWLTVYGHCDTVDVKVKDKVKRGQTIAIVGNTGNVTEPQLYFSIRKGRTAMDPLKYLSNN